MPATMTRTADADRLWAAVLGRLEIEMTPANYITWMDGTRALSATPGLLTVEARSAFVADELNRRFRPVIERSTSEVAGEQLAVEFVPPGAVQGAGAGHAPAHGWIGEAAPAVPQQLVGALNAAFTLESYIEAEGNVLALQSCTGIVEGDGLSMSPVVVHAAPGLGKTHLLHAVGHRAVAKGWAVACLSSEQFTNRYLTAMRDKDAAGFQAALRGVRLLIIDDLQYLEGKSGTASELVHTIDAVTNAGGHVIVASERHPSELDLPERLASRLTAGLVTAIEPFRADERRTFVERAAAGCGISLPGWAVDRIASVEAPSVRALRGAFNRALALARCDRLSIERLDADLALAIVAQRKAASSTPAAEGENVLERVARVFEVAVSDLTGRSRAREVSDARAVAAHALREQGLSLAQTAEALGNRDRSTVRQLAERGKLITLSDAAARLAVQIG